MTVTVHLPTQIEAITLPAFLQVFADELRADPVTTLRDVCALGLGHWISPTVPCTMADTRRPATHLHEITLLGVNATGDTEAAAAAHWVMVAHRIQQAAAPQDTLRGVAA